LVNNNFKYINAYIHTLTITLNSLDEIRTIMEWLEQCKTEFRESLQLENHQDGVKIEMTRGDRDE